MAINFHSLKLKDVKRETPECVSLTFDIPAALSDAFRFREGQNITIKKNMDGEELRRSYSICAAPYENVLKVAVKEIPGGKFSAFANHSLKPGDELEVMPPTGKFNAHIHTGPAHYLAIAAGSGITPVISIIKHTLSAQPDSRFTLIFGNRTRKSIIFFEELEAIKNKYMDRFNLIHILSRERVDSDINYGRIDAARLEALQPLVQYQTVNEAYICGPEAMINEARQALEKNGLSTEHIHFELFNAPVQPSMDVAAVEAASFGEKSEVTIKVDGRSFEFSLPFGGQSILDAALERGADLPYACKGGVCCSCRAKVIEGAVEMQVNYALEKDEVEQGFVLTCQSHPRTKKVVIDFDVR